MSASILYVDDDPRDLELHELFMREAGFTVYTANGTRAAMEIFMREAIDLVLLDFSMGETDGGIIGFEMRRRKPAIKIAFFCGAPSAPMPTQIVDAVIDKALDPGETVEAIRRVLAKPASQAA